MAAAVTSARRRAGGAAHGRTLALALAFLAAAALGPNRLLVLAQEGKAACEAAVSSAFIEVDGDTKHLVIDAGDAGDFVDVYGGLSINGCASPA